MYIVRKNTFREIENLSIFQKIDEKFPFKGLGCAKAFEENKSSYRNQIIFCFLLLFKTKRPYVDRLNEKDITENKNFWKAVKPLSSLQVNLLKKVTLVESNKILPENEKVVRTLNEFFSNIVKDLLKFFAYISQNVRFVTCLTKILDNILFNN